MEFFELSDDAKANAAEQIWDRYMTDMVEEYNDDASRLIKRLRNSPNNAYGLINYGRIEELCIEVSEMTCAFWHWLDETYGYRKEGYSWCAVASLLGDFMEYQLNSIEKDMEIIKEDAQLYDFDEEGNIL